MALNNCDEIVPKKDISESNLKWCIRLLKTSMLQQLDIDHRTESRKDIDLKNYRPGAFE